MDAYLILKISVIIILLIIITCFVIVVIILSFWFFKWLQVKLTECKNK